MRARPSSSSPKRCATTGCCSSPNTALAVPRDAARASASSSARAAGFTVLCARPVMVKGRASAGGAVPNTLSITGAAASRSGTTTRMSPGAGASGSAHRASSVSCSTSSSRVRLWHTCSSMLRSVGSSGRLAGARSCSVRMAFCTVASRLVPGAGSKWSSSTTPSPQASTSAASWACVCWPQAASRRWPVSRCWALPAAARRASRRGSTTSNQYSAHGFSA